MGSSALREKVWLGRDALQGTSDSFEVSDLDLKDFEAFYVALHRSLISMLLKEGSQADISINMENLSRGLSLWQECQLFQLMGALLKAQPFALNLFQLPNGVLPIEHEGWFPAMHLPVAGYHEEMGFYLLYLYLITEEPSYKAKAEKLLHWQKQLLTSEGLPLYTLFSAESPGSREKTYAKAYGFYALAARVLQSGEAQTIAENIANYLISHWGENLGEHLLLTELILARVDAALPKAQSLAGLSSMLCDPHSSLVGLRLKEGFAYATLCGGYSGLGSYCHKDVSILSWGPQTSPLGDCEKFGIVRPCPSDLKRRSHTQLVTEERGFRLQGVVKVGQMPEGHLSSYEVTDASYLPDEWLKVSQVYTENKLHLVWNWLSFQEENQERRIVFFIKATSCLLGTENKPLASGSLERYYGDIQKITFSGEKAQLRAHFPEKYSVEIAPLGGSQSFWSADYLLAITVPSQTIMQVEWVFD